MMEAFTAFEGKVPWPQVETPNHFPTEVYVILDAVRVAIEHLEGRIAALEQQASKTGTVNQDDEPCIDVDETELGEEIALDETVC